MHLSFLLNVFIFKVCTGSIYIVLDLFLVVLTLLLIASSFVNQTMCAKWLNKKMLLENIYAFNFNGCRV